jgi:hypothetical protein
LNVVLGGLEVVLGFETNAIFQMDVVVSLLDVELFQGSVVIFQATDVRAVQGEAGRPGDEAQCVVEPEHRLAALLR